MTYIVTVKMNEDNAADSADYFDTLEEALTVLADLPGKIRKEAKLFSVDQIRFEVNAKVLEIIS